jgi:hypothetical protein
MFKIINFLFMLLFKFPFIAENGDIWGKDNDGDGKRETEFVKGYYKGDGENYVKSHFRKKG